MSEGNVDEIPAYLRPVLAGAALLCLLGAAVVGWDFYGGIFGEGFTLVRVTPVLRGDGARFYLMAFGEGLSVAVLLALSGLMAHLFARFGRRGG